MPEARAYFDYAATAPLRPEAARAMAAAPFGNPSSLHAAGKEASAALEAARAHVAAHLGARAPHEIVFTGGGTESDNTAVRGLVPFSPAAKKTHVVVSAIEHEAVLEAAVSLKERGYKVDLVPCGCDGIVAPAALEELLDGIEARGEGCALVAVMWVNNETGAIQPVEELARLAHSHGALFFTDAVQALGKVEISLEESGVDAASFSAHKIGGPAGVGALYLRRRVKCRPFVRGGGQEGGMRSGTVNVAGIAGFSAALEASEAERAQVWEHVAALRARLVGALAAAGTDGNAGGGAGAGPGENPAAGTDPVAAAPFTHPVRETLDAGRCVPHTLHLLCAGLEGQTLVLRLDEAGFCVSAGSACGSKSLDPSHVLTAMGIPRDDAFGSLRVSLGAETTGAEVDALAAALKEILA